MSLPCACVLVFALALTNKRGKKKKPSSLLKASQGLPEGPVLPGLLVAAGVEVERGSRAGVTEVTPAGLGGPGSCGRGLAYLTCQETGGVVRSAIMWVSSVTSGELLPSLVSLCSAVH